MSDEKTDIKLSKAAQGILDDVKKLSVLELADLVKAMEEEFGVSAAAPVAVAAGGAPAAGGGDAGLRVARGDAFGGVDGRDSGLASVLWLHGYFVHSSDVGGGIAGGGGVD